MAEAEAVVDGWVMVLTVLLVETPQANLQRQVQVVLPEEAEGERLVKVWEETEAWGEVGFLPFAI